MEVITSKGNPLCTHIRKLNASRKYRRECGELVGEGPKLLEEAVKHGVAVTALITPEGVEGPDAAGCRRVTAPMGLFRALCDTQTPQGVLFTAKIPRQEGPKELPRGRYLVLDGVQDPGNVGTIWRSADALGADGLILLPGCADPWSPKTVRSTMGACFRLPVWEWSLEELTAGLGRLPLYATALRQDTVDLRQADLTACAVVIGSEGKGVSPQVLAACEKTLKIPMRERCESLNAAAAAAVVLWEMVR